jgi:hypothetical protein
MLRAYFFLTVAYVIGFAIAVLFAVVYGLISEGRLLSKDGFFLLFLFGRFLTFFLFLRFGICLQGVFLEGRF